MDFKINDILNNTLDGMSQESLTDIISKAIDENAIKQNENIVSCNKNEVR